jgi:pimeloyl-ACP methyl ester carboxylesterase
MDHDVLELPDGRRIAYRRTEGRGPWVVFLGGFRSDMTGTKAAFLEEWARGAGRGLVRFDYTGHGASSGAFRDGCIGDWAADAEAVVARLTDRPCVLVGSSMGGWIALLLARKVPDVRGLVGISAAPDFTEDLMWARFSQGKRRDLEEQGFVTEPSEYSDEPDLITKRLIEDGREQLVLREPLRLEMPVRLLHGTADEDVPADVALRLLDHADCPDMRLTLVKGADHRFSTPECLALIAQAVEEVSGERNRR